MSNRKVSVDVRLDLAAYVLLTIGVVLALFLSFRQTDALRGQLCLLLDRSERGLPANPYFRDHPERLALALADVKRSKSDLGCN
jgi:hypothetical protein